MANIESARLHHIKPQFSSREIKYTKSSSAVTDRLVPIRMHNAFDQTLRTVGAGATKFHEDSSGAVIFQKGEPLKPGQGS